jgi:hypothetical protein
MRALLAGLVGRRHRGILDERQGQLYARRNFLGTLMRYFLLAIAPLPVGQREPAFTRALVSATGRGRRFSMGGITAKVAAIAIAVVAPTAQEEHLSTSAANDEPERVHGLGGPQENWTCGRLRATDSPSATGLRRHDPRARSCYSGPSPFIWA